MLMGVFSERPCFTGNSVSSEHPPCFHYFGLAQPTTVKQMSKTSAVWQHFIKKQKKSNAKFASNSLYITARLQTWHIT